MPQDTKAVDVIVVDDNEDLLELATRALSRAGFTVAGVTSFDHLDETLSRVSPRLILMDVQMPELFGDEVAATLRNVRGIQAKIYLHSSLDGGVLAGLAKSAGVDGWITKSDGIKHLVDEVRALLVTT